MEFLHEFDSPSPSPDQPQRLEEERKALSTLDSEDFYWDLNSPEGITHRLGTRFTPPTPPSVTPFCPKNTFKEFPSRHVAEDIDPSAGIEQVSVDVSDFVLLEPKQFEYDALKSQILCRTRLDAQVDAVVTEVVQYLAKVAGQSMSRYREFGLTVPTERLMQESALKGPYRLYEFAYFQIPLPEYPVDLDFLPVWDYVLASNLEPSSAQVTLRIGLGKIALARHISPAFSVHSEILLNVDLQSSVGAVVKHCLGELDRATAGKVRGEIAYSVGFVLNGVLFDRKAEMRSIPIISHEREHGENRVKLVIIDEMTPSFAFSQAIRQWTASKATLRVDVSDILRLAAYSPPINPLKAPFDPLIRTLDLQLATITVKTSLLSPPLWLLREVLSIIKLVYGLEIEANDAEELVLKGFEEEEYLTEDHQLQYYDLIRNTVAEDQPVKLKLVSKRLKSDGPAVNFLYKGEIPCISEEVREPKCFPAELSTDFLFTIKNVHNLQGLFKSLDRVLPTDVRSKKAKGCLGRMQKKLTPRYIGPKAVYEAKPGPHFDMTNDSAESFRSHAEALLEAGGVTMRLESCISLCAKLLLGDEIVAETLDPAVLPFTNNVSVNTQLIFDGLPLRNYPSEIRLGIEVKCGEEVLACVAFPLFEQMETEFRPRFGEFTLKLWPLHCLCPDYVTMLEFRGLDCAAGEDQYATITVNIPFCDYQRLQSQTVTAQTLPFDLFQLNQLAVLLDCSPVQMEAHKRENRAVTYNFRHFYKRQDIKLVYFLNNVVWTSFEARDEAVALISQWSTLSPEDAVCLLSCQFFDARIRAFVVGLLDKIENQDLVNYIPQLAQALFFELRHNSALESFLIKRALADPYEVGHQLFWCLRSQLPILPYRERLRLVIERFAMRCGNYRRILATEVRVMQVLKEEAALAKAAERRDPTGFLQQLKERLQQNLPEEFMIPTSTTRILLREGLECEVMESKLKPIRFVFRVKGSRGRTYQAMLKTGDDLRQDMLILQLFRIMQQIWRDAKLPVRLKTYRVVAIDQRSGMIEMVPNSTQISKIHIQKGLLSSRSTWIHDYILANNADYQSFKRAQANFMISSACYSAATYILGIGDRHDGNIMVDKSGVLFHIDFGHILGNFKKKWFIRREHYKVKYSEDMDAVLDISNSYESFLALTQKHYNAIRAKGHRLFYLMKMMSTGGMPELQGFEDLQYLVRRLKMEKSDRQVKDVLRVNVEKSKSSVMRRIDRFAHNLKHFFKTCRCTCPGSSDSS